MHSREVSKPEGTLSVPSTRRSSRTELVVFLVLGASVLTTLLLVVVPGIVSG